jgi:hypothetical protein
MRFRWLEACLLVGALCSVAPAHGAGLLPVTDDSATDENDHSKATEISAGADSRTVRRAADRFLADWNLAVNLQILAEHGRIYSYDPSTALVSSRGN